MMPSRKNKQKGPQPSDGILKTGPFFYGNDSVFEIPLVDGEGGGSINYSWINLGGGRVREGTLGGNTEVIGGVMCCCCDPFISPV